MTYLVAQRPHMTVDDLVGNMVLLGRHYYPTRLPLRLYGTAGETPMEIICLIRDGRADSEWHVLGTPYPSDLKSLSPFIDLLPVQALARKGLREESYIPEAPMGPFGWRSEEELRTMRRELGWPRRRRSPPPPSLDVLRRVNDIHRTHCDAGYEGGVAQAVLDALGEEAGGTSTRHAERLIASAHEALVQGLLDTSSESDWFTLDPSGVPEQWPPRY